MPDSSRIAEVRSYYAGQSAYVRAYVALRTSLGLLPAELLNSFLPRDGIIADIGCGYGVLANQLAMLVPDRRIVGIDADAARIRVARASIGNRSNIDFICQDASTVTLPDLSGVVMVDFLHHLRPPTQARMLTSIASSLRPGGAVVIREVNPEHRPRWKYWCSVIGEVLMYPSPRTVKLQNRAPADLLAQLGTVGVEARLQYADRGTPFAAVLYVGTKHSADPASTSEPRSQDTKQRG